MTSLGSNPSPRRMPERKPDGPRKVRHGVKLRHVYNFGLQEPEREEPAAETAAANPLADRWFALFRSIERVVLLAGYEYAKVGQIVKIDWQPGLIEASVQGTAQRPYTTRIRFSRFTDAQWKKIVESMSSEAMYLAKLLAHELPPSLDQLLSEHNLELLPGHLHELKFECTCAEAQPCKHIAAIAFLGAERLVEDPLHILDWRGMPAAQVIEHLRRVRTIHSRGAVSAHGDPMIPESQIEPPPLEACLDNYWHANRDPDEAALRPAYHARHALLRRLGPSPVKSRFPIVGLLASVYDTVAADAERIREQDPEDNSGA